MMELNFIIPLANLCVYEKMQVQYIVVHCLDHAYAKYALSTEIILISNF